MTTSTLPEGWYTDTAEGTAHHAYELIGNAVRPVCSTLETDGSDIRATQIGDRICDACIAELRDGGADVVIPAPLGLCLGCHLLQHIVDPGLIATHHRPPDTGICSGSSIRPAGYDGRDAVRSRALAERTDLRTEIWDVRRTVIEAVERDVPFHRITESFTMIMKMEAQLPFWDHLIRSGDYLEVAGIALRIFAGRAHAANVDDHLGHAVQMGGARRWLYETCGEIQKAARKDGGAAIALLDAVLAAV